MQETEAAAADRMATRGTEEEVEQLKAAEVVDINAPRGDTRPSGGDLQAGAAGAAPADTATADAPADDAMEIDAPVDDLALLLQQQHEKKAALAAMRVQVHGDMMTAMDTGVRVNPLLAQLHGVHPAADAAQDAADAEEGAGEAGAAGAGEAGAAGAGEAGAAGAGAAGAAAAGEAGAAAAGEAGAAGAAAGEVGGGGEAMEVDGQPNGGAQPPLAGAHASPLTLTLALTLTLTLTLMRTLTRTLSLTLSLTLTLMRLQRR
jgi:hypothetical protein